VLGIVGCGEVQARAFVIGMASGTPVPADALETTDDAALLAVRLRALALMLCVLLAQAGQITLPAVVLPRAGRRKPGVPEDRQAPPPAPDTS
jgi:hypothetical protein